MTRDPDIEAHIAYLAARKAREDYRDLCHDWGGGVPLARVTKKTTISGFLITVSVERMPEE